MNEVKTSDLKLPMQVSSVAASSAPTKHREVSGQALPESKPPEKVEEDLKQSTAVSQEDMAKAVSTMNDYVQNIERDLIFSVDEESGRSVVTVVDRETDEVVRQFPDEVFIDLARNLKKDEPVHLFSAQA